MTSREIVNASGEALYSLEYNETEDSFAASEFIDFMKECTGADFSASEFDSKIVIGKKLATDNGMSFDELTTDNGYVIKAVDDDIYVYGKTTQGTLNGIYELLNRAIELEIYTGDCYTYTYNEGSAVVVECKDKDSVFNPGIDYIYDLNGETRPDGKSGETLKYSQKYQKRMSFVTDYYVFGGSAHAETAFVQNTEYFTGTLNNGHMPLDEKTAKEAANWFYDIYIKDVTSINEFLFGLTDDMNWYDETTAGQARTNQYIEFMNMMSKELSNIMNEKAPDRNITLVLLAYHNTVVAPSVDIVSQKNIKMSVMYAPIQANWYKPLADSVNDNSVTRNSDNSADLFTSDADGEFKNWKDKVSNTGDIYLWSYHTMFTSYLTPLDCINSMRANYKLAYEMGVKGIYDNVQYDNAVATDWNRLKTYLRHKLAMNPEMSDDTYNTLIEKFMDAYFGPAADSMKKALEGEMEVLSELYENQKDEASIWGANYGCGQSAVWYTSQGNYKKWGLTRSQSINITSGLSYSYSGKLKTDVYQNMVTAQTDIGTALTNETITAEESKVYLERIKLETISVRFVLLSVVQKSKLDAGNLDTWEDLANDCNSLGITKYKEGAPTTGTTITADLLKTWAGHN